MCLSSQGRVMGGMRAFQALYERFQAVGGGVFASREELHTAEV